MRFLNENFDQIRDQFRADVQSYWIAREDKPTQKWPEWAGYNLSRMLIDREFTKECLRSEEFGLRLAAISLLAEFWTGNEEIAEEAQRLAYNDPQPAIRGAALFALLRHRCFIKNESSDVQALLDAVFGKSSSANADFCDQLSRDVKRVQESMRSTWIRLGGENSGQMLESKEATLAFLKHADPKVRLASLLALRNHWKANNEVARVCETLLTDDKDDEVRAAAVSMLGVCYSNTDNRDINRQLAYLVSNESLPSSFRTIAYRALLTVRGFPISTRLNALSKTFEFPKDVDWNLVNRSLENPGSV